jgi:hypothetical protein
MNSHKRALRAFGRKLAVLLVLRSMVRWTTFWFFLWGVVALAGRISGAFAWNWLLIGLLGAVPFLVLAIIDGARRRAGFPQLRAAYDGLNRCGGLIMAEEVAGTSAWLEWLPQPAVPTLRWQGGRAVGLFVLSVAFFLLTLLLPDRFSPFAARRPLEIGKLVGELSAQVTTLEHEKILEENKAADLQKQLARLKEQSSAMDPNKTWEALDHIQEANSDLARRAAEEALSKTASLSQAETLAGALQQADPGGLGQDTATRAAQDLAAMLKAARLDEGVLKGAIPQDLLSQLDGLSKQDLAKLLSSIEFNKNSMGRALTNLAALKLIDPKLLSQCRNAGQCPNPSALAEFLCQCTNACDFSQVTRAYCRGGIDRGRGDAPMTWKDESSDQGAKFKEETLPSSTRLSDSQFVGVSRAAPELSGEDVSAGHGALENARGSGGAANAQVILPRHKQAVQRFFERTAP